MIVQYGSWRTPLLTAQSSQPLGGIDLVTGISSKWHLLELKKSIYNLFFYLRICLCTFTDPLNPFTMAKFKYYLLLHYISVFRNFEDSYLTNFILCLWITCSVIHTISTHISALAPSDLRELHTVTRGKFKSLLRNICSISYHYREETQNKVSDR